MKLSYLQRGEGRDLVMLHGYLSMKESFYPQIEYFSKFYRVTALDFPGMGGAEALTSAFSVGDYADWTLQALSDLGIAEPLVLAHSFGGRVTLKILSRGPYFDRAAIVGCAGIVKKRGFCYRARVRTYRIVKKIAPKFAESRFGSGEYRTLSPLMRESYKKIVNEDLRQDARKIGRPVLFLNGSKDEETPGAGAKILHGCVKDSKLVIIENCGHFAHLEDPLAVQLAVEEFYNADL